MKHIESILLHPSTWFVIGVIISLGLGFAIFLPDSHTHDDTHPIGYANSADEVHVHSDWVVYLDGVAYDLTDDAYMTSSNQTLHEHIHLHDNNDDVIHRHDHGITLTTFLDSLGFTFSNDCITTPDEETFCDTETKALLVYVNGEPITDPANYVNQEEDKILIYYGSPDDTETIAELQTGITDDSCYYSGTCPERGTPPPESCGLTCEL